MLSVSLDEFIFQLKDGAINNVGAPTKSGEIKLYDVSSAEAREFGDEQVKLSFHDDDGNMVEVALDPSTALEVRKGLEVLEAESRVFE